MEEVQEKRKVIEQEEKERKWFNTTKHDFKRIIENFKTEKESKFHKKIALQKDWILITTFMRMMFHFQKKYREFVIRRKKQRESAIRMSMMLFYHRQKIIVIGNDIHTRNKSAIHLYPYYIIQFTNCNLKRLISKFYFIKTRCYEKSGGNSY